MASRLLRPPKRTEVPEEERTLWDETVGRLVKFALADSIDTFEPRGYYGALLNSPPFAAATSQLAMAARSAGNRAGTYSHADREWVDQVLSYQLDFYTVRAEHTRVGEGGGARRAAYHEKHEGRGEDLTDDERLLKAYI